MRYTPIDISGRGAITATVIHGEIESMKMTEKINVVIVSAEYMTAGPTILRTALMSFVAYAMISPGGVFWKNRIERVWICARKSLRRSYSISRLATMIVCRTR